LFQAAKTPDINAAMDGLQLEEGVCKCQLGHSLGFPPLLTMSYPSLGWSWASSLLHMQRSAWALQLCKAAAAQNHLLT